MLLSNNNILFDNSSQINILGGTNTTISSAEFDISNESTLTIGSKYNYQTTPINDSKISISNNSSATLNTSAPMQNSTVTISNGSSITINNSWNQNNISYNISGNSHVVIKGITNPTKIQIYIQDAKSSISLFSGNSNGHTQLPLQTTITNPNNGTVIMN